ncbi:MAG: hypothetical protein IPF52_02900 [Saprospiraceae bacterium]|nr:hypothetical protein [Saprospiraceae bacterium]
MEEKKIQQPQQIYPQYAQDEEITLKEIIAKILEFWSEVWSKKWWIILFSIPFILYFGYKAKKAEITYIAQLTYTLNEGSGSGGALSGILGSFGLGKGGKINLDKIVELSRSRNIQQKVLFQKLELDTFPGKPDIIANHIITLYKLDELWTNKVKNWTGFRFKHGNVSEFSAEELQAFKRLFGKIIGGKNIKNNIFSNSYNEDTGILTLSATTVDEQLSIEYCNLIYNQIKQYYLINSTKGNVSTFEFAEAKSDSIFSAMQAKELQLAKFNDSHRNLTDPSMITRRKIMETELLKLKTMYAEVTKNRELADFTLSAGTPDISIIDEPIPPLEPMGASLLIELIKGALLGGLLSLSFVLGRKIVLDAMRN